MNVKKEEIRMTYDEFVKEVVKDPQKSLPFDLRNISYEQAKDYLMVDVCNEKMNKKDLCKMPHERKGELALRYLMFWEDPEGNARVSVIVNDTLMRHWGIAEDTLRRDAWENMKKKMPPVVRNVHEVVGPALAQSEEELEDFENFAEELPMFCLLTNSRNFRGASYMLDEATMSGLAARYEDDLVILPSSIHEVLFMRKKDVRQDVKELAGMVVEINENQVPLNEILSDNAYVYSRENHSFSVISGDIALS